jgi:dTDP-4-dehydrorhamnose reductase
MRIAIVGARGQLGSAMVHECRVAHHDVATFDRASLDITDGAAVAEAMGRLRPEVVINCTGFNAVDAAESQPVQALVTNAIAVRTLARAATQAGATLVHFSTDFVFDGTATSPMTEAVAPNPRSTYAVSKLLGEWFAADAPRAYVLRVESLFGIGPDGPDKGSLATIVKNLREGTPVRVFRDRTVSPTHVGDAAAATRMLLERGAAPGVYHCVNTGSATWLGVAQEAARQLGVDGVFDAMSVADVSLPAARPQYCALSNAKLSAAVGYELPTWQDALRRYLQSPVDPR